MLVKRRGELALCIAGAVAVVWSYALLFHHAPLGRFVPTFADEVFYYKQAAGFVAAGFHHGQWGAGRQAAALGGCDVHGCGFMVVTGLFGRVFGWSFARAIVFNFVCLAIAALCCAWLAPQPRRSRTLVLLLLLLSSDLVVAYVHATMQEVLHVAGAFVLAAAARRFVDSPKRRWLALYFAVGAALGLVRVTWIIYLPLAALLVPQLAAWRRARIAAAGALVAWAVFKLSSLTNPAGGQLSPTLTAGPSFGALASGVALNLKQIFTVRGLEPLYVLFHATWIALLIAPLILSRPRPRAPTLIWAWVGLAVLTAMQLVLYQCAYWRDYRVMHAPLAIVIVALALDDRAWLRSALLAFQLVCLPLAVSQGAAWNAERVRDPAWVAANRGALGALLPAARDAAAGDRWCRTVAVEWSLIDWPRLLAIPDGLGLEIVREPGELVGHPARFLISTRTAPPGDRRLIGRWEPGLFVYEKSQSACRE